MVPHLPVETIGNRSTGQHLRQSTKLLGAQLTHRPWSLLSQQRLLSPFAAPFHPLAYRSFRYAQGRRDSLLFPPGLGQFPGTQPTPLTPLLHSNPVLDLYHFLSCYKLSTQRVVE